MKNLILSLVMLLSLKTWAQETVMRTTHPNYVFTEKYEVLKSDKKIRQGVYKVFFNDTTIVAEGYYTNNMRTGLWNFYNARGKMVQSFDYDLNQLDIKDTADAKYVKTYISNLSPTDTISPALKIGGFFFGYYNYNSLNRDLGLTLRNNFGRDDYKLTHILTLDAVGKVTQHQVYVNMDGKEKMFDLDISKLTDEDRTFIPTKVNGKRSACKLYFDTTLRMSISTTTTVVRRF